MKIAKATAQVLDLTCPHCDEPIEDPRTGSYMITSDSFPANIATCLACGKSSRLPRTAHVFVGG